MAFGTIAVNIVMTAKRKTVVAEDRTTYRIVSMTIKIVVSRRTLLNNGQRKAYMRLQTHTYGE